MGYMLCKEPIQYDTLYVVQYIHYLGKDIKPSYCIERNHPPGTQGKLPSIYTFDTKRWYRGIDEVMSYYEEITGVHDLLNLANEFKEKNPNYRINK